MKGTFLILLVSSCLLQVNQCLAQETTRTSANLIGVFDGRTPCQDLANQLNEKVSADCIKIKWRLFLHGDPATGDQGTYELWGLSHKKDNPLIGKWRIIKGTQSNPEAIVYQLDWSGNASLFLQKADDNILFFLDQEKKLMVGNRDFSYTLNRVERKF